MCVILYKHIVFQLNGLLNPTLLQCFSLFLFFDLLCPRERFLLLNVDRVTDEILGKKYELSTALNKITN